MMTMKDKFLKMLMQALVYKKIILWMDLDIWSDDYIWNTVVQSMNEIIVQNKK